MRLTRALQLSQFTNRQLDTPYIHKEKRAKRSVKLHGFLFEAKSERIIEGVTHLPPLWRRSVWSLGPERVGWARRSWLLVRPCLLSRAAVEIRWLFSLEGFEASKLWLTCASHVSKSCWGTIFARFELGSGQLQQEKKSWSKWSWLLGPTGRRKSYLRDSRRHSNHNSIKASKPQSQDNQQSSTAALDSHHGRTNNQDCWAYAIAFGLGDHTDLRQRDRRWFDPPFYCSDNL